MVRNSKVAVVASLVLAATALVGCGDDDPVDSPVEDDFDDPADVDEDVPGVPPAWLAEAVAEDLTGHIITFPDGSTARCVVLSSGEDQLECL